LIRLHFVVEGQAEEAFANTILAVELAERQIVCDVHKITTRPGSRRKYPGQGPLPGHLRRRRIDYRGGWNSYEQLQEDLLLWMKQEAHRPEAWFTTMVDFYELPADFPGFEDAQSITDPRKRVEFLESKLAADLDHRRFVPHIQLHEFEALLFSDPQIFGVVFPDDSSAIAELQAIRQSASSPEHIDDGEETAPSKRIIRFLPDYEFRKASAGPEIAKAIGLARIRKECAHFNAWIEKLLALQ
jgi:hypothetical protein